MEDAATHYGSSATSTVVAAYRFRGYDYHVTLSVAQSDAKTKGQSITMEVEDQATADQWRASFTDDYIQDLTHKTGNYKQFDIFVSMIESALTKTSDSVSLDLLTYADLQMLRNQRSSGSASTSNLGSETLTSKRYLILTYTVEFDRIHYPLPLPYLGKPDPVALLQTIRELRAENEGQKKRMPLDESAMDLGVRHDYERQLEAAITTSQELERKNQELSDELLVFREGRAAKEIRMLKGVVASMEEDLLKEKNRHQRSSTKTQQELRRLREQVEALRTSETDLKVRVKSLTSELSSYKRPATSYRPRSSPAVRPFAPRTNLDTRPSRPLTRAASHDRTAPHRSVSNGSGRDRSISGDRFLRNRSASGDRASRDRNVRANGQRLSSESRVGVERATSGTRLNSANQRFVPCRSPSPSATYKRFNPTDYVKQRKEKERERELRKLTEKRHRLGSGRKTGSATRSASGGRVNASRGGVPPRGSNGASPEVTIRRPLRGRTSSGESLASNSRSSSVESLCSERSLGGTKKQNPWRPSDPRPPPHEEKRVRIAKVAAGKLNTWKGNPPPHTRTSATGNHRVGGSREESSKDKENLSLADAVDDADDTHDVTADVTAASVATDHNDEMAEIDARLNALQDFMKNMGHE